MIHMRPLVLGLAAFAALSLAGCGDERELGYKDVEIDEYKRQITELENELYNKNANEVKAVKAQGADLVLGADAAQALAARPAFLSEGRVVILTD